VEAACRQPVIENCREEKSRDYHLFFIFLNNLIRFYVKFVIICNGTLKIRPQYNIINMSYKVEMLGMLCQKYRHSPISQENI